MRAVICRELSGIDALVVDELPSPPLPAGTVRIAVGAAGVNFADTLIVAGKYQVKPPLPFSPGFEVAGRILEAAPDVDLLRPGDRVLAVMDFGGYAEEVVVPAAQAFPLPDAVDDVAAAGFAVAYGTSHLGLRAKAGLRAGETLLVLGAAGGVGLTAVEIGKRIGATVIAAAGGADKLAVAAGYGADHLIDSRGEDIRARVGDITGGRGVDVVYDPVGGAPFEAALRSTAPGGRILIVGFASGAVPQIPANLLLVKNITAIGYTWGPHWRFAPDVVAASFDELLRWLAEGLLRPHISRTHPLAEAVTALKELVDRKTTGKVVLTMGRPA
jgi:NADPH2:quinone reductase